ncbi:hypothetical protein YTPLAS18_11610 [Nitrospira sp.]|nr:hypothetical protein YTPLAS18_11610 [Nitrospira sp.]
MKHEGGRSRFDVLDEEVRMACMRLQVERTSVRLQTMAMTREDAQALIDQTRRAVLAFFPGKNEVFDLVLLPRFERLFQERVLLEWGVADSVN